MAEIKTVHRVESKSPFLAPNESFFIEFKPLEGVLRVRANRTTDVGVVFKNNSPFDTKKPTVEEFLVFNSLDNNGPSDAIPIKILGGIQIDLLEPISNTKFRFLTEDFISSTIFIEPAKDFFEFSVPKSLEKRKWKCTFTNITQENSKCRAQIRFPFNKIEIKETRIPRRLLNRTFNTLLLSLGLQVFARKGKGNLFVDKDFEHLINGSISKEIEFRDDAFFSVDKFKLKDVTLLANEFPPMLPAVANRAKMEIEFDFESDIEIGVPIFNANITNVNIKLGFVFNSMQKTANEVDGNVISPIILIDVKVEGKESIPFFKLKDIEDKIGGEIFLTLHPINVNRAISEYLTKGFMELAQRGDIFWGITSDDKDYIVEHFRKPKILLPGLGQDILTENEGNVLVDTSSEAGGQSGGGVISGEFGRPNISFSGTVGATTAGVNPVNPTDTVDPIEETPGLSNLDKIEHIVVLMMENRSFDHMLGYLTINGKNDIDGITGNESNINPITQSPVKQEPLKDKTFRFSPHHEHQHVLDQMADGTMQGFLADFMGRFPEIDPLFGMGYYNEKNLEVYDFLASEYTVCNKWFCSHPGPTFPNRICTYTGKIPELDNFSGSDPRLGYLKDTTIFDTLTANNKTWAFFEQDMTALRMFDKYRLDDTNILPLYKQNDARDEYSANEVFFSLVENGNLPQVTFLDPNFVDLPPQKTANDDHPPANVEKGQEFIRDVYNALASSPQWEKTMFIITYDEHGGFYDHVAPPGTKASAEGENIIPKIHKDGPEFYGPRVPAFVISPWVEAAPSNIIFDHTSIIKTILTKFNNGIIPDEYGERVKQANHLGPLLSKVVPINAPKIIDPINPSNATTFIESFDEHVVDSGGTDFHSVLQSFAIPE